MVNASDLTASGKELLRGTIEEVRESGLTVWCPAPEIRRQKRARD
jgi:hypothetical protein